MLDQEDSVELELHALLHPRSLPVQRDEGGLRMPRLAPQATVALAHGLYVQHVVLLFHQIQILLRCFFIAKVRLSPLSQPTRITD